MFSNLGSMTNFENFHFFSTPSEYSEKNRCSEYNIFKECHLFVSEYSGAGLKNYWIRNTKFNFSLSLSFINDTNYSNIKEIFNEPTNRSRV